MSPWAELGWFEPLKETTFSGLLQDTAGNPSIGINRRRVAIGFYIAVTGQTANVNTVGPAGANIGPLVSGTQKLEWFHKDWPGMPQSAWFLFVPIGSVLIVYELVIRDWPPDEPTPEELDQWSSGYVTG